jgi:L-2-hydroxyglutarate oxidase LhgO
MSDVNTIVVGGGAIGLAIAARLSKQNEVMVLEQHDFYGQGISSRNSEVIHAGIYYKTPVKAEMCVRGKALLYEYCAERQLPHQRLGKLIVATSEAEYIELESIHRQAKCNGVADLQPLDKQQIESLEPHVKGYAGLLSPSSGIVSAHDFMKSLAGDVSNQGGQVVNRCQVKKVSLAGSGFSLNCDIDGEGYDISCDRLVVAAGFGSHAILEESNDIRGEAEVPKLHLCKGRYFSYSGSSPFKRLIYPVPEKNMIGLGIHATLDIAGQVKFGPDTEYVDIEDYSMPGQIPDEYVDAIRKYFPEVQADRLSPDYSGIRPKLSGPGETSRDFLIEGPSDHGIENHVRLFGIESPGLTSSMAIAELVESLL